MSVTTFRKCWYLCVVLASLKIFSAKWIACSIVAFVSFRALEILTTFPHIADLKWLTLQQHWYLRILSTVQFIINDSGHLNIHYLGVSHNCNICSDSKLTFTTPSHRTSFVSNYYSSNTTLVRRLISYSKSSSIYHTKIFINIYFSNFYVHCLSL